MLSFISFKCCFASWEEEELRQQAAWVTAGNPVVRVPPPEPSRPPGRVRARSVSASEVEVSWKALSWSNSRRRILGYEVPPTHARTHARTHTHTHTPTHTHTHTHTHTSTRSTLLYQPISRDRWIYGRLELKCYLFLSPLSSY